MSFGGSCIGVLAYVGTIVAYRNHIKENRLSPVFYIKFNVVGKI